MPAESATLAIVITAGGAALESSLSVVSVDIWSAVNKVPRARIVLYDGSPAGEAFPISDQETFLPGQTIEIKAGYDDALDTIFSGIVIAHGIEISQHSAAKLVVDAADPAIKMTVSPKTAVFEKLTDAALISQLIDATAGLTKDVSATPTVHEAVVQHHASDWDTMLLRAEMNGLVVTTAAGKISVKAPDTLQAPLLRVAYGESILDLEAVTGAPVAQDDLEQWSSSVLLRSKLAKIQGRVHFSGSALAKPGSTLELAGVGARFNGSVFVSAVHHDIRSGRWLTTVDFGLASDWFADKASVAATAWAGHVPPIKGLQTGIVKQITEDPSGESRVLVTLPIAQDDSKGIWARLSLFYASNTAGAMFYPEVGDEVVVGFMNEDPRFPIILGSVYSSKLAPPYMPDTENRMKGIVTRSKMEMSFNEADKIITIRTPGRHVITLDDASGEITIADRNGNSVALGKSGITLDSASTLQIKAKGDIDVTAGRNLSMKAAMSATCEGMMVDVKAQDAFSAQGNASAELKAAGIVTVQGALVKIN